MSGARTPKKSNTRNTCIEIFETITYHNSGVQQKKKEKRLAQEAFIVCCQWVSDWVGEWLSRWVTEWMNDWQSKWMSDTCMPNWAAQFGHRWSKNEIVLCKNGMPSQRPQKKTKSPFKPSNPSTQQNLMPNLATHPFEDAYKKVPVDHNLVLSFLRIRDPQIIPKEFVLGDQFLIFKAPCFEKTPVYNWGGIGCELGNPMYKFQNVHHDMSCLGTYNYTYSTWGKNLQLIHSCHCSFHLKRLRKGQGLKNCRIKT